MACQMSHIKIKKIIDFTKINFYYGGHKSVLNTISNLLQKVVISSKFFFILCQIQFSFEWVMKRNLNFLNPLNTQKMTWKNIYIKTTLYYKLFLLHNVPKQYFFLIGLTWIYSILMLFVSIVCFFLCVCKLLLTNFLASDSRIFIIIIIMIMKV